MMEPEERLKLVDRQLDLTIKWQNHVMSMRTAMLNHLQRQIAIFNDRLTYRIRLDAYRSMKRHAKMLARTEKLHGRFFQQCARHLHNVVKSHRPDLTRAEKMAAASGIRWISERFTSLQRPHSYSDIPRWLEMATTAVNVRQVQVQDEMRLAHEQYIKTWAPASRL